MVIGQANISVWRNDTTCVLDFRVVDSEEIRPVLGIKACLAMNIIQFKDNDLLNKPKTRNAPIYPVEGQRSPLSEEELCQSFERSLAKE